MQPEYVCERPSPSTPPRCGVSARFRGAFDFRVWDPDPRHGVAGSVRRQLSPRGQNLEAPRSGPRLPPTKNVSPHGESPAQTSRRHAQGERCEEKGCVPSAPGCRGAVFESVLRMVRMPRGTVADLRTVSISALSGAVGPPAWLARSLGARSSGSSGVAGCAPGCMGQPLGRGLFCLRPLVVPHGPDGQGGWFQEAQVVHQIRAIRGQGLVCHAGGNLQNPRSI